MKNCIEIKTEEGQDYAYLAGQKLTHYGENIQVQLNNVKNENLTNPKKNLKHRFRKEESEMINDLGHILEPSIVLSSENEEVVKALECVSLFFWV